MFTKSIAVPLLAALVLPFVLSVQRASCGELNAVTEEPKFLAFEGKDGPGKGKHVVFLSGDEEYRSEEAMPMLAKILSQKYGFKCTVLFSLDKDGTINPNLHDSLPGSEALDTADVVVTSLRFRSYGDDIMAHFAKAYDNGAGFVGLRTSTHAFSGIPGKDYKKFNGFGKNVYGEGWVNHWGGHKSQATRAIVDEASKDDPLFHGVADIFVTTDVYEAYPATDSKILLRGQVLKGMTPDSAPAENKKKRSTDKAEQGVNEPMMPIAWTRLYKNEAGKENKIFCTTMGAANDLENEGLRRLIVNAVFWGARLEIPAKADVAFVDEYKPLNYGFDGYRFGLKVSDLGLGKTMPILPTASEAKKKK